MKRITVCFLTMILFAMGNALASGADPHLAAATSAVPTGAKLVSEETDDGFKEYEFRIEAIGEAYQVKIDPATGAVFSVSSELKDKSKMDETQTETADTQAVVLAEQPGAEILHSAAKQDDGKEINLVLFRSATLLGEYEIDAQTGTVRERELYPETLKDMAAFRTPEEILSAIEAGHSGAQVKALELSSDDGSIYYEGNALLGNEKYDFQYTLDGVEREWEKD